MNELLYDNYHPLSSIIPISFAIIMIGLVTIPLVIKYICIYYYDNDIQKKNYMNKNSLKMRQDEVELRMNGKNKTKDNGPEEQVQCILCTEENTAAEYELIIRVGNATPNFDLKHAYLDILLYEQEQHQRSTKKGERKSQKQKLREYPVGIVTRFNCARLNDPICAEMHLLIGMYRELGHISGLQANHNQPGEGILLYEYILLDLMTDQVMQICQVNQYITSEPVMYRGKKEVILPLKNKRKKKKKDKNFKHDNNVNDNKNGEDDSNEYDFASAAAKVLMIGFYPDVPVKLNPIELLIITCFSATLNSLAIMVFECYNFIYGIIIGCCSKEDGSLYRSFCDLFIVSLISIGFICLVIILYKNYFKR